MVPLKSKIKAEVDNIEVTLSELEKILTVEEKGFVELAALATILHNFYNGVENVIKQILREKNRSVPRSKSRHKELLETAHVEKIMPADLKSDLYEFLAFRHYFVHGYAIRLEELPMVILAERVNTVWRDLLMVLKPYYQSDC
jgi:hypothetical protein